ncbi:MAG TPA: hypothetical protein VF665_12330 [Longimicrobium sp.]|jgi:signal transduction histidine kinase|uniref:hypothetical protein n=1 Tax=Longimicrobium sp. TaxID=2029185 RepID=UPI002ED796DD
MIPDPPSAGDGRSGPAVRDRLEQLGQLSAELLHDLADVAYALEQRTRLAAAEARRGRPAVAELERTVEASAELGAMLRDTIDTLRGAAVSPEVAWDPRATVERAVRRFVPVSGPAEVRLVCDLPPGTTMGGRESFLSRLATHLLLGAARRSRGHVLVELTVDPADTSGILLSVCDDGPAPEGSAPAPHPRPSASDGWRPGIVSWLVGQLNGGVRSRPARAPGGSGLEIRLPARVP